MSAPVPLSTTINFAAPSAVNNEVKGLEANTTEGLIYVSTVNYINRIVYTKANADNKGYIILKRAGIPVRQWSLDLCSPTQQGPYFPGFPVGLAIGNIQVYLKITEGTLGASSLELVTAGSLTNVTV